MTIYEPAEDSYLLAQTLKNYLKKKPKSLRILDMGAGSGIQAKTCKDQGCTNLTTADINPEAIAHLKKQNLNPVLSDLFTNINGKFDLIICNPPYLPEDEREPKDSRTQTTAGKKGYELITKFLTRAAKHLAKDGTILLLFSSLSKPEVILKHAKNKGFKHILLTKKKIPFEELYVYEFSKNSKQKPF